MSCGITSLPISYLGLPLTHKRPDRACFQILIDKIRNRLQSWQGGLISRAGRVVLTKAVLSSMPILFMSVFSLPAWVIKEIDKIRRTFIWNNGTAGTNSIHLLSWDKLCLPIAHGGLGLLNLKLHNVALLLRWIWRLYKEPHSQWATTASKLYAVSDSNIPPLVWKSKGSFFWRQLQSLRYFFQISTVCNIHNGSKILFWYDKWGEHDPWYFGFEANTGARFNKRLTLKQAIQNWYNFFPAPLTKVQADLFYAASCISLTQGADSISWKWNSNGEYSAASLYKRLVSAGKISFPFAKIWKLKAPPSIKLFLYFLAHHRILTQDQLIRRNMVVHAFCHLCQTTILENAQHLFCDCSYAKEVWMLLNFASPPPHSIRGILQAICSCIKSNQHVLSVQLATALWGLWLERNSRIFRDKRRAASATSDWILQEAFLFLRFC